MRALVDVHGPFVSVYLLPSADIVTWRSLRGQLDATSVDGDTLAALDEAVSAAPHRPLGRVLVAAEGGILIDEAPSWSPAEPVVRLSDLPYLLPLASRHDVREPAPVGGGSDAVSSDRCVFDQFLFEFSRPDGPAVDGLRVCTAMLRDGNVDALVIAPGQLDDRTVWVGNTGREQVADDAALRGTGQAITRQRADEALPMAALAIGAEVVVAPEDLPLTDGVGVLLGHPRS